MASRKASLKTRHAYTVHDVDRLVGRVTALERENRSLREDIRVLIATVTDLKTQLAASLERETVKDARIKALEEENKTLRVENDTLRSRLAKLEPGPSTPPSKLPKAERYPPEKKEGTSRKTGGQIEHEGATLKRREPTRVVKHKPAGECSCGRDVASGRTVLTNTRQVIDIQFIETVTDHVVVTKECVCGMHHTGEYPPDATAPVSYGATLQAFAVALTAIGLLPSRVVAGFCTDHLGMPLSPATLDAWVLKTAGNLEDHAAAVRDDLRNAEAVCADETGVNTSFKKNAFVHVACTDKVTLYHFGGRGIEDIKAGQVIDTLTGALVSDCYTAYNEMTSGLLRQWCLAHLIREAEYHEAYYTKPGPTSLEIGWQGIVEVLEEAISLRRENPGVVLPVGKPRSLLARRVRAALKIMEADTRKQAGRPRAYLQRLLGNPDRIFTFLEHPSVPPTNNLAEQALRPIKVKQNRSRVWRSLQGIETHLAVAGYLETCRKQGYNQAEGIKAALAGKALLPA